MCLAHHANNPLSGSTSPWPTPRQPGGWPVGLKPTDTRLVAGAGVGMTKDRLRGEMIKEVGERPLGLY